MSALVRISMLAFVAALVAATPASAAKTTCTKRSGDTLLRDGTLRVYTTTKTFKSDADKNTLTVRFCKPGSKAAPKKLVSYANDADLTISVHRLVHAGNRLALEQFEAGGASEGTTLRVYDLTTRRYGFQHTSEGEYDWTMTSGGGVAILEAGKLVAVDGAGPRELAATGASALASTGDTVYWTAGGAAHSATLAGAAKGQ